MFGFLEGDFLGDVLGYFLVVSILFLPLVLFVPYAVYEIAKRFPWAESRDEWRSSRERRRRRKQIRPVEGKQEQPKAA